MLMFTFSSTIFSARLRHTGDAGDGWFVENVEVEDLTQMKTYNFPINRWLDKDRYDKKTDIIIEPEEEPGYENPITTGYKISVKTGDKGIFGFTGTDANVYLQLIGTKGKTDDFHLADSRSNKNPFEKGRTDIFEFPDAVTVGKLTGARLRHSGEAKDGWFCDKITVEDLDDSTVYNFPVNRWLDKNQYDRKTSIDLKPNVEPGYESMSEKSEGEDITPSGDTGYKITVKTGDKGILGFTGTDADVILKLVGSKGKSEDFPLLESTTNKNPFERNQTDVFEFPKIESLGRIKSAELRHTGGDKDGWFCDSITVEDLAQNKTYNFPVNRWLDANQYDGKTSITLVPDQEPGYDEKAMKGKKAPPPTQKSGYRISVKTGDKGILGFSGTDADVFLQLVGVNGKKEEFELKKSVTNKNPFERGQTDVFEFPNAKSLGKIKSARIRHTGGEKDGWFCDSITVEDRQESKTYNFPVNRWLDANQFDGKTAVDLTPNKEPGYDEKAMKDKAPDKSLAKGYRISVKTGDKGMLGFSGTDADVFLQLVGTNGKKEEFQLKKSVTNTNPFERGQTDVFEFPNAKSLGKITSAQLRHTGGDKDGWFCDSITVEDIQESKTYSFPVNRWLDANQFDGKTKVDLSPNKEPGYDDTAKKGKAAEKSPAKSGYRISVKTGDKGMLGFSGTDADVFLQLFGTNGRKEEFELKKSVSNKDPFERGRIDVFEFPNAKSLGKITAARLRHTGGDKDGWFCDYVTVEDLFDKKIYNFPVNRWLDANQFDGKTAVDLTIDEEPGYADPATKGQSPPGGLQGKDKNAAKIGYKVTVKTGDKGIFGFSGTDANVFLKISGQNGKSEEFELSKSITNKDPFEKGQIDIFEFPKTKSIGKIASAELRHTGGDKDGWFCDSVTVEDRQESKTYNFPVDRWLDANQFDGRTTVTLIPNKKPGYDANSGYKITVKTGDLGLFGFTGTDSQINIKFFGDKDQTDDLNLKRSLTHKNPFERGNEDVFVFPDVKSVGKINRAQLWLEKKEDGWFCDEIVVQDLDQNLTFRFPVHRWLDASRHDGKTLLTLKVDTEPGYDTQELDYHSRNSDDDILYEVSIKTGDKGLFSATGTNAPVFLAMYGDAGSITRIPLKKSNTNKDPFERGKTDEFNVFAFDIGDIQKIKLWHEGGKNDGWFVDWVNIKIPTTGKFMRYEVNQWLDKDSKFGHATVVLTSPQ